MSLLLEPGKALFTGDALPLPDDLPIYDDPVMSLCSIERIRTIGRISSLFSAWDEPRAGEEIPRALDEGYHRIDQVHEAVRRILVGDPGTDLSILAEKIAGRIGLAPGSANPMVMRTVQAHVRVLGNAKSGACRELP